MITIKDLPTSRVKNSEQGWVSTIGYKSYGPRTLYLCSKEFGNAGGKEAAFHMSAYRSGLKELMGFLRDKQIPVLNISYDLDSFTNGDMCFCGIYIFLGEDVPVEVQTPPKPVEF